VPTLSAAATGESGKVSVRVSNVEANTGTVASVVVSYGAGASSLPVTGGSVYTTTIGGLTDGRSYTFQARVCNSAGLCTSSPGVSATPYGPANPGTVSLSAAGASLVVAWTAASGDTTGATCSVRVSATPASRAIAARQVGTTGGTFVAPAVAATSYRAIKTCQFTSGSVTVQSGLVTIP
jgi:hypothetical protein